MHKTPIYRAIAIALAAATSTTTFAQNSVDNRQSRFQGLEEVVVTAQKRAESLQDTPISIVALTSSDLEHKGVIDIRDLPAVAPGLQVGRFPSNALTALVFLRGVGSNDDSPTFDPSVAVYLDGVYVARSQGLAMEVAEVERIEVLRGPQGSLYGRNATGGAINYITKAPDLGQFGFKQTLTAGNYDMFRSRTRVNIPVGDTLAIELAYLHSQQDGYVKNLGTGVKRFGDQRRKAYRTALRWTPSDALDIHYSYDRSELEDTPQFAAQVPLYPNMGKRPSRGSPYAENVRRNDATSQGHNLTVSWEVADNLTLKSITGYRKLDNYAYQNNFAGVLGPIDGVTSNIDMEQDQFSQEFQAIGDIGQLEYVVGAYYFNESIDGYDDLYPPAATGASGLDRYIKADNTAYALYGQMTYRPTFLEDLYVTVGLRGSRDEREASLAQIVVPPAGAPTILPSGKGDRDFSNLSPSFIIGYDISYNTNIYFKYARGYKTGGYNTRASTIANFEEGFDEETLDSFELGLKSSWLNDRLRLNAAAFLAKYEDIVVNLQVDPIRPTVTDALNAGKATIRGVELDLTARPLPGLTLGVSYSYLDTDYDKITDQITGANIADQFNFIQSPRHMLATNLQYEFPATPIGILTAHVDYSMQSEKYMAAALPSYVIDDYDLVNARLTLSDIPVRFGDNGSLRLSVFGKNLTDEEYYVSHYQGFVPAAVFGEPRTYGIELTFEY